MGKIEAIGGQAVIEGVMIRAPKCVSVAVRKPNSEIVVKTDAFRSLTVRVKLLSLPFVRGVINLFEMMIVGMKALNFSAEQAFEDEEHEPEKSQKNVKGAAIKTGMLLLNVLISLALGVFLFKFIPLFLAEQLRKIFPVLQQYVLLFNLADGLIRIGLFFLFIFGMSQFKDFRRIFEYHGAEHKTIFAYEKGLPLTVEHASKESKEHPRCGTSFIIIVLIISIIIFSLVPRHPDFFINFLRRLSIIPLIAGVAYEILKFTAKYEKNPLMRLLTYPGIFTQYITTKEPDHAQIEVAIAAVKKAVEFDGKK